MKPKLIIGLVYSLFLIFFFGCSTPQKFVKFQKKDQEPFTNNNLQKFLKNNPNPKIVLRVPNVEENVTTRITNEQQIVTQREKERNDLYYNAIEKELLKAGFSVRDRGLFNEVLKKMQRDANQNIDYSQIKDLTNTDLILEVVKIDPAIKYVTNKYYTYSKKNKVVDATSSTQFSEYGASAEFKIIMVSNNELAGSYKFHYTPCMEGCPVASLKLLKINIIPKGKKKTEPPPAYDGVVNETMESNIKFWAQELIKSVKQN